MRGGGEITTVSVTPNQRIDIKKKTVGLGRVRVSGISIKNINFKLENY